MAEIRFAELDFAKIKQNLKAYLQSQTQFKDYNFEGSAISTLLDVLAYNTAYNGFYLNMLSSEMFLDSASLRESVVSHAKHLGFVPRSVHALRTRMDITLTVTERIENISSLPFSLLISPTDQIYCVVDGVRYDFSPVTSTYVENPELTYSTNAYGQSVVAATFTATNVEFVEGKRFTHRWTVDNTTPVKQRFIIPNNNVDMSMVKVSVQDSAQSNNTTGFLPFNDLNTLNPTNTIYYTQEVSNGRYEIVFGDGVLGKALADGNIVIVDYVVASGNQANKATSFKVSGSLGGVKSQSVVLKLVQAAGAYQAQETLDQIKFFAPKVYNTQNRAVTKSDYETLLKREIPSIKHLRVWGGEENVPPVYGKVFCAIQPDTGRTISEEEKARIINTYIKPRSVLSIQVELVEPAYLGLQISSQINYFSNKTTKNKDDIKNLAVNKIKEYRNQNLVGFDADFRYSKLIKEIDSVDSSIESNLTEIKMKYRLVPAFDVLSKYSFTLNNPIDLGDATNNISSVNSTGFLYNGLMVYISDNGQGKLYIYYLSNQQKIVIQPNAGTVNYKTGEITIENLLVTGIPNGLNYIDLIVTPAINDIIALRNQILLLDDSDINVQVVDLLRANIS